MGKIIKNKDYMLDLCVRMAHHSTAIEGNTLSQDETASIILDSFISKGASEREVYEVRNYRNILPLIIESLENQRKLDNELIKNFHKIIMQDLIYNNGSFKQIQNVIVGSSLETSKPFLVPTNLKDLSDNLYFKFQNSKENDDKIKAILEAHIDFEKIHPFSDGNGRTGRLMMVYSCLEQDLTPIVIPKEDKTRYINILKTNDIKDFLEFAKEIQSKEYQRFLVFKNDKFLKEFYDKLQKYQSSKNLLAHIKANLEKELLRDFKELEKQKIKFDDKVKNTIKELSKRQGKSL